MECLTMADSGSSSQSQPTEAGLLICLTVPDFSIRSENRMILLTEKKKRISVYTEQQNHVQTFSPKKKSRHKEIWFLWQCGYSFLFLSIL